MTAADRAGASNPAWARAKQEHREAVAALLDTIRGVGDDAWLRPVAPGKWSPAQIVEHLALAYEGFDRDLSGAGTMRPIAPPWQQRLLRWFLLPHILFHRSIPLRARSPREARPSDDGLPRHEAPGRLAELAGQVERNLELALPRNHSVSHPYFGPIPPLRALRFCAAHLEHHRRQMPGPPAR